MQNRFILADVPLAARQRGEALREVVEENICWVDRMALLRDGIFAFELHLENMRDLAIEFFNRNEVVLDADGDGALRQLRFRVRAAPVSHPQSAELLEKCPENGKGQTAERLQMLALTLHDGALISLKVRNTPEGGTGSHAWRGGLLLAQHVCLWHSLHHSSTDIPSTVLESLSSCCESTDAGGAHEGGEAGLVCQGSEVYEAGPRGSGTQHGDYGCAEQGVAGGLCSVPSSVWHRDRGIEEAAGWGCC